MSNRATPQILSWIILILVLLAGVAGLAASLVPVSTLTGAMSGMSGSGDAAPTIMDRYTGLVQRTRMTSLALLLVGAAVLWQRRWLERNLARLLDGARQETQAVPGRLRRRVSHAWRLHRMETLLFLIILFGGVVLRVAYIDRDMRHDEAWTYMVYARRPLYLSPLVMSEVNHHPLNTLLIQLSVAVFGNGPPAIRLPAFLFGLGCIPAGYVLARLVWGRGTALFAAAAIAASSPLIEYSVNARGYSAVTFFGLVMLAAGYRAIWPGPARSSGTAWGLVIAAGMAGTYANPVMMLPGIAAFTWFVLLLPGSERPLAGLRSIVLAGIGVAVGTLALYLPFFTTSGWDVIASSQGIKARASIADALATAPRFGIMLLENWDRDFTPATALIAVLLALLSAVLARQRRWPCFALLCAFVVAGLFQFIAVRDPGPERVWLSFLPMLLILAGSGLDGVIGRFGGGPLALPGLLAIALGGLMGSAVLRSGTLLTSTETAYFPEAQSIARELFAAPAGLLAITAVRGDEVAYYALRDGLLLVPVRTEMPLRFYRSTASEQSWLYLVFDKILGLCQVQECLDLARRTIGLTGEPEILHDDPTAISMRIRRTP